MPNSRGMGDELRLTERDAVLVGAPRSALAGNDVRARPAVTAAAATTAPARGKVVMVMAASWALGGVTEMTPWSRRGLANGRGARLSSVAAPGRQGAPGRRTTPHASRSDARRARPAQRW